MDFSTMVIFYKTMFLYFVRYFKYYICKATNTTVYNYYDNIYMYIISFITKF